MVVVGFAAVFVLQAAVAQDAQLAVPPAWAVVPEREPDVPQAAQAVAPDAQLAVPPAWRLEPEQERDVPQAAQPVVQDALPEPIAALVAHSVVSPGDPQAGLQDDWLAAHC